MTNHCGFWKCDVSVKAAKHRRQKLSKWLGLKTTTHVHAEVLLEVFNSHLLDTVLHWWREKTNVFILSFLTSRLKLLDQFRYWSASHFRCCTFSTMQIFIVCSDYLFHWIDVLSKYVLFNNSSSVALSLTFFIIRFWVTAWLTQTQMTFLPRTFVAHWIFIYKWDKQLKPSQFYK